MKNILNLSEKPGLRTKIQFLFLVLIAGGVLALCCGAYVLKNVRHETEHSEIIPQPVEKAWKNVEDHLAREKTRHHFGGSLPASVTETLTTNVRGRFSVYLEDLRTGTWWGINEQDSYVAWSLLKVSTLVALLKKVEREQLSLDNRITLTSEEKKRESPFVQHAAGESSLLSVKKLAERMIEDSDDAATMVLCPLVSFDEFQEGLMATEMPPASPPNKLPRVSPMQYANLLRSLFFSNYLKKPSSELVLSLLSNTVYNDQIRAGVPKKVLVAHKVGFDSGSGDFHDCGIVFLPKGPYILCVMSTNTTKEESDRVISSISRQIYEFIDDGDL
ncbi:MAG: class A beta-lactamase-related serine hydrolase [Kiritimatiellae bacterium]|nr:class A beta-lactamase-related serine hydrolase [Kiritimatiellia bacterium]MDD5523226.1 class A beta-lactamase-related serine hydrolase [Kiritimatiellia bacterium]